MNIKKEYGYWKVVDPEIKLIKMGKKSPRKIPHVLVDDGFERKLMNLHHLNRGHSTMSMTRYWNENKNKFSHPDYQKFRDLLLYKDYVEVARSGQSSVFNGKRGPAKTIEYKGIIHPLADFCREFCGWAHKTTLYKHHAAGATAEELIALTNDPKRIPKKVEFEGIKYSICSLIKAFKLNVPRSTATNRLRSGQTVESLIKEFGRGR